MNEIDGPWMAHTFEDCIDLVKMGGTRKHIVGGFTIGQPCWCKPTVLYHCDCNDDIENEPDPNCWKCGGEGLAETGLGNPIIQHDKIE